MAENKFKNAVNSLFWNSYATAYDDIAKYYRPYKALMNVIIDFISGRMKQGRIYDAGCGTGELSANLATKGFSVSAVDISDIMLAVFKKKINKLKLSDIEIFNSDLNSKARWESGTFDAVVNVHSLFMIENKFFALDEFVRVLKKGGYLLVAHHKPIKLGRILQIELEETGILRTLVTFFRLLRVAFFNIILGQMHRKIYGEVKAEIIAEYLAGKGMELLGMNTLYSGFDDLIIMKKK